MTDSGFNATIYVQVNCGIGVVIGGSRSRASSPLSDSS